MVKCSIPKQNLLCIEAAAMLLWLTARLETERRIGRYMQTVRLAAKAKSRTERRISQYSQK